MKEKKERIDVEEIIEGVKERKKIVLIENKEKKKGNYMNFEEVRRINEGMKKNVMMVIEEEYEEYVRRKDYEEGMEIV